MDQNIKKMFESMGLNIENIEAGFCPICHEPATNDFSNPVEKASFDQFGICRGCVKKAMAQMPAKTYTTEIAMMILSGAPDLKLIESRMAGEGILLQVEDRGLDSQRYFIEIRPVNDKKGPPTVKG